MRTVQLGDVAIVDRAAASVSECRTLPYVGLEHIKKDAGNFEDDFRRKPESLLATKFKFDFRHVLYGKLRPYLNKVALPDFVGVCTTEILPLLPKPGDLERGYLRGLLLSSAFVKWASQRVSGANLPRLDPGLLEEYSFVLPELNEQRRIAERLEKADGLRRTRRYALELSATFLPAAFLQLFGDPVRNPKQWQIVCVEDVTKGFEGGVNFKPVSDNAPASDWRVLKVSAVSSGEFRADESKPISPKETFDDSLIVRQDDLIMSRANTVELVGAVCRVRKSPPKVLLPDKLWRICLKDNGDIDAEFLLQCLRMPSVRREIGLVSSGTSGSMKNISQGDAGSIRIPLPPLPPQQQFAGLVARVERLRAVQRESLRQAEHLFQSLLHQAFAGAS